MVTDDDTTRTMNPDANTYSLISSPRLSAFTVQHTTREIIPACASQAGKHVD